MIITLLLGGVVFDRSLEDPSILEEYRGVISELVRRGMRVAIVAGGGRLARRYIGLAEGFKANKAFLDEIGILATRLNASIMVAALGEIAHPTVLTSYEEAVSALKLSPVVVLGGIAPAQSTDAVAAVVSEFVGAPMLVKATGAPGIFDRPPSEPGATLLEKVSYEGLREIVARYRFEPGGYELLDPIAIKVLERSSIRCIVLDGLKPRLLLDAIEGKKVGTVVGGD
ncbi:MAG: UMP kinase [Thermoproteota archaeon]|nr:MAG: UMP kinase [Candidatus Korarchaeota archaeon]